MKRRKKNRINIELSPVIPVKHSSHTWYSDMSTWWSSLDNVRKAIIVCLLAIIGSFLLYGNSLPNGFVYDDVIFNQRDDLRKPEAFISVWSEPQIPNARTSGAWRPLTFASYVFNYVVFGNSGLSFRVTSIMLHAFVSAAVVWVIYELTGKMNISLLTGGIFLLLPIHAEAVNSNKSRDELLVTLFGLIAWSIYVRIDKGKVKYLAVQTAVSVASLALALLSKESALSVLLLPLATHIFERKVPQKRTLIVIILWIATTIGYLLLRYQVMGSEGFSATSHDWMFNPLIKEKDEGTLTLLTSIFTAGKIYFWYLVKSIIPIQLSATYGYNSFQIVHVLYQSYTAMIGLVILISILIAYFIRRIRSQIWYFGIVFFTINISFYLHLLQVTADAMAERWAYRSTIGIACMLAAFILWVANKNRIAATVLSGFLVISYFFVVILYNPAWKSELTLARFMIASSPASARGYINQASTLSAMGRYQEAQASLTKALEINPRYIVSLDLQAKLHYAQGNIVDAYKVLKKTLEVEPSFGTALINLGRISYQLGFLQESEASFKKFFDQNQKPYGADEVSMYSLALIKNGKFQDAITAVHTYLTPIEYTPRIHYVLSLAYFKMGDMDQVEKYLDWSTGNRMVNLKALSEFVLATQSAALEEQILHNDAKN